jgi:hypothetical protein
MGSSSHTVDLSALKVNQLSIIALTLLGFILNQPILPGIVAVILIAGSVSPRAAVFKLIYQYGIQPLGILTPNISRESPAPHLFAQLVGGIFLAAGSIFLFLGYGVPGWILSWVVILLATVNLVFGFCAGCFVYFQLGKRGVRGFRSQVKQTI